MSKRAQRRHHYQRLKKKVQRYYGGQYNNGTYNDWADDECGSIVETRPACSCSMCGNPRRKTHRNRERLTIQEQREFQYDIIALVQEYLDDVEEMDNERYYGDNDEY